MLTLNVADKIFAGVNQSYTLLSDEGQPSGKVVLDGSELEHRVIRLGPPKDEPTGTLKMKYKVSFYLPPDAVGRSVELRFQTGSSTVEEKREIIDPEG